MTNFKNNDFESVMLGRHSVRKFDTSVKIPREELKEMVANAITAPSACNLQAWHFIVVDTPEGKDKLRSFFMKFNLPRLETSSAIVMLFGDTLAFKKYRALWENIYEQKQISKEELDRILNTFLPLYENADKQLLTADAMVDSSLAAMQFMLAARAHGYDTNPIAGYDAKKAATALGLDPERYVPVMAIAVGKADSQSTDIKSTRYSVDDVIEFQ